MQIKWPFRRTRRTTLSTLLFLTVLGLTFTVGSASADEYCPEGTRWNRSDATCEPIYDDYPIIQPTFSEGQHDYFGGPGHNMETRTRFYRNQMTLNGYYVHYFTSATETWTDNWFFGFHGCVYLSVYGDRGHLWSSPVQRYGTTGVAGARRYDYWEVYIPDWLAPQVSPESLRITQFQC